MRRYRWRDKEWSVVSTGTGGDVMARKDNRRKRMGPPDEVAMRKVMHIEGAMRRMVETSTKIHLQQYEPGLFAVMGYRMPDVVLKPEELVAGVAVEGLEAASSYLAEWLAIQVLKGHAIELRVTKPRPDVGGPPADAKPLL